MTEQQAQQIADTLQTLRAQLKAAWEAETVQENEECLRDAIGYVDTIEWNLAECDLIPIIASK